VISDCVEQRGDMDKKDKDTKETINGDKENISSGPEMGSTLVKEKEHNSEYKMDSAVIKKYTKYPLDDYYASYYDTLSSGKRYRRFSWKAFFFGEFWGAFRLINDWIVFAMICMTGLAYYSLSKFIPYLFSESTLHKVDQLGISLYPFSDATLIFFACVSTIASLFIGFIGDFIYAKYGILHNKYKWKKTDKKYQSYSAWRVIGVIIACKLLFGIAYIICSRQSNISIPLLVWSMFAIVFLTSTYLVCDYFTTDPKKLAESIGSKEDYIYATALKSEEYFENQFRKYESTKKCEFNWCAAFFPVPYIFSKGVYKIFAVVCCITLFLSLALLIQRILFSFGGFILGSFILFVSIILFIYIGRNFNKIYYKKIKKFQETGREIKKLPRIIIAAILWMFILV